MDAPSPIETMHSAAIEVTRDQARQSAADATDPTVIKPRTPCRCSQRPTGTAASPDTAGPGDEPVVREPQLARDLAVRPIAGRGDDFIDDDPLARLTGDLDSGLGRGERLDGEAEEHLDFTGFSHLAHPARQPGTLLQLVVLSIEEVRDRRAPDRPTDRGSRGPQLADLEQGIEGGVAAPNDQHALARIAVPTGPRRIRNAVEHPVCDVNLSQRRRPARAERIGSQVRPRSVEHTG